ncbi:SGNH/GDSL hydrolase family protein [Paenibacillus sp. CN-4]|uniref:SGNH/GDSL hydrolase family protein n=1 Tax=Paenibacillus nanchangensis TaxID=3348343 RepID=UPI00397C869C
MKHSEQFNGAEEPLHSGYVSATPLSTAANHIMNRDGAFTQTFRSYIRLNGTGTLPLRFWHSNAVDSTWDQGREALGGEPGGSWRIEAAYIADGGPAPDGSAAAGTEEPRTGIGSAYGSVVPGTEVAVTFDGAVSREVAPGECFWSDEAVIDLPEGHLLAFTWTLSTPAEGKSIPFNVEGNLASGYEAAGSRAAESGAEGFKRTDNQLVLPSFIGWRKPGARSLVMLGDSITQGVRTARDGYEYWAARIAAGLGEACGVWNIGSGWARTYDVLSESGSWLRKARQGDELLIVLGVNDLDIGQRTAAELLNDLEKVIREVRRVNPACSIMLGTVPPFNFAAEREGYWREVNGKLRTNPPEGVDRVFDIAEVLSVPEPDDHRIRPEYMSNTEDPHPNGEAGKAVAEAFLAWYRK